MKTIERFRIGDVVHVMPVRDARDNWCVGKWFVVGRLAPADLKLAKHPDDPWEVMCHLQRIEEAQES